MLIIQNTKTDEVFDFYNKIQLAHFLIGSELIEAEPRFYFENLSPAKILNLVKDNDWILTQTKEEEINFHME